MTSEEIAQMVEDLDQRVERIRVLYDQYFMGIEKIPPLVAQKEVDRRFWLLRKEQIRNTALRFRFQQIVQRYNTFSSYWIRIMREIENGTYRRDVLRAKARQEQRKPSERPKSFEDSVSINLEDGDLLSSNDYEDLSDLLKDVESYAETLEKKVASETNKKPSTGATQGPAASKERDALLMQFLPTMGTPVIRNATPGPSAGHPAPQTSERQSVQAREPVKAPSPPPPPPKIQPPTQPPAPRKAAINPMGTKPPSSPPPVPARGTPPPRAAPSPVPPVRAPSPVAPAARMQPPPDEFKQVYDRYIAVRKQNGESTSVPYDSLSKNLKETASKLRAQYAGRNVDFDVIVKDGKTMIKPTIK